MTEKLAISIVVAHPAGSLEPSRALAAIRIACRGMPHELVLVRTADRVAGAAEAADRELCLPATAGTGLVPELWAHGLRAAQGDVVAFTTSHMVVGARWARSLVAAVEGGATGAGGGIEIASDAGAVDRATWLLRYSAFRPPFGPGEVREIAGDNAAYRRDALVRHLAMFRDGFWEVEFHARLRAEGGRLAAVPDATASMVASEPLGAFMRHRFAHGTRFGAWRVRSAGMSLLRVVLAAPLVPLVITGRSLRRVADRPRVLLRSLVAVPALLLLGSAWAAGEAWGALNSRHTPPLLHEESAS